VRQELSEHIVIRSSQRKKKINQYNRKNTGKKVNVPARFVKAFDSAKAEETPFPPPDMSSPNSSLANLSFICSISELIPAMNVNFADKSNKSHQQNLMVCYIRHVQDYEL